MGVVCVRDVITMKGVMLIALAVTVVGCGSVDRGSVTGTVKPGVFLGPRPRVEGVWRVVTTDRAGNLPSRTETVHLQPACGVGACSFVSVKSHHRYNFDKAVDDYTHSATDYASCWSGTAGNIYVRQGYRVTVRTTVRVTKSVSYSGHALATVMLGHDLGKRTALSNRCRKEPTIDTDIAAVRLDRPSNASWTGIVRRYLDLTTHARAWPNYPQHASDRRAGRKRYPESTFTPRPRISPSLGLP